MSGVGVAPIGEFVIGESPVGPEIIEYVSGVPGQPIGEFAIGISAIGGSGFFVYPRDTDIRVVWDPANGQGDWQLSGADLLRGDDLQTQVLVSLFTDRVANADDVIPDGTDNRRGWWGDTGSDVPIGSRLWLLDRSKLTSDIAKRARDYCVEALAWLVDDKAVAAVEVDAVVAATRPGRLVITVRVLKNDGTKRALNFVWVWKEI